MALLAAAMRSGPFGTPKTTRVAAKFASTCIVTADFEYPATDSGAATQSSGSPENTRASSIIDSQLRQPRKLARSNSASGLQALGSPPSGSYAGMSGVGSAPAASTRLR